MSLLTFLKSTKNARKIFGKRELVIIKKQLLGVNLTQSEKNRLSRDIRKKFEFIRETARFQEALKLKKGSEIKRFIEEAKEVILNDTLFAKIMEIILFGSVVENTLTLKSDIDMAVRFDEITLKDATLFRKRISGRTSQRIDIQVYNHLPHKIREEIDSKGRIIYKK